MIVSLSADDFKIVHKIILSMQYWGLIYRCRSGVSWAE